MQLTRFTDLGLRILMLLTQQPPEELATNQSLARAFHVPHNHVIKVVHRLGKLGWVETRRGRGGGLKLAVDPNTLHLGEVVRALEQVDQLVDCEAPPCMLRGRCLLKGELDDALEAFYRRLDERTLADVAQQPTRRALIQLVSPHSHAR